MMSARADDRRALSDIIAAIKAQRPVHGKPSSQWQACFSTLRSFISRNPSQANDDRLIYSLVEFASEFADTVGLDLLQGCHSVGIGSSHGLWFAAIALKYEHLANYITCLALFKEGLSISAEPILFLSQQFSNFKQRMIKRLSAARHLELGVLDDALYLFVDGDVACRCLRTLGPSAPKHNFIADIGFISAAKTEKFRPGYDPALLLSEDGREVSFEEARLNALGVNFVAQRQNPSPVAPAASGRSERDDSFQFSGEEAPRGILKRRDSPKNTKRGGVRFEGQTERKPSPVASGRRSVMVGETVLIGRIAFSVTQRLGEFAFLCSSPDGPRCVIKPIPTELPPFSPENEELFCLPIGPSSQYYATHYHEFGTFNDLMAICHDRPHGTDAPIAWFCLLQLARILRNLEHNAVSHGAISGETLLNRLTSDELPKSFDLNGIWRGDGLALCRCDRLTFAHSSDRLSVANLFHLLSVSEEIASAPAECPRRWNKSLWDLTFATLLSDGGLDRLIEGLIDELSQDRVSVALTSRKSRINYALIQRMNG